MGAKYHPLAMVGNVQLIKNQRFLVTTDLVIAETYGMIRRTAGYTPAQRFLHSLGGSPRLLKVYSEERLESQVEKILECYSDQDFSYTDAVSFVVMQERGIDETFTFDSHFAFFGFRMFPGE